MSRLPDHHVHTQWSWDAPHGDMERTCARAVDLGLPSIAFTDHADWVRGDGHVVDLDGYLESIERCRTRFPDLRILSGIELGEPHRYAEQAEALLRRASLDRVLGSVHCLPWQGRYEDASRSGFLTAESASEQFRSFLADTLAMLAASPRFEVLAHLDYPKRYWPEGAPPFDPGAFEEETRAVLRSAAGAELVLEVNTTRGGEPERYLCPGPAVLRWWREEGGRAVAFGSDAHDPDRIALGFERAAEAVEAAGFKPQDDPSDFWRA